MSGIRIMDHKLPLYQRMLIRMHILMCKYCSRFQRQLLLLREFSRNPQLSEYFSNTNVVLHPDARTNSSVFKVLATLLYRLNPEWTKNVDMWFFFIFHQKIDNTTL